MKRVTTGDIARAANVSRTTVSFVLNNRGENRISQQTRQHVLETAQSLGYVPSAASRTLRHGRNNIVACIAPKMSPTRPNNIIRQQISTSLWKHGFIAAFIEMPEKNMPLVDLWSSFDPAAVLIYDYASPRDAELLSQARIPFVDGVMVPESVVLGVDQAALAQTQVEYLVNRGHQRIAYLADDSELESRFSVPRRHGAREMADKLGAHLVDLEAGPNFSRAHRKLLQRAVEEHRVTAIAAFNDEIAALVLRAARELSLEVPRDLAVMGVDDLAFAPQLDPPLTTIAFHYEDSVEQLTSYLLELMAGSEATTFKPEHNFSIVKRESV